MYDLCSVVPDYISRKLEAAEKWLSGKTGGSGKLRRCLVSKSFQDFSSHRILRHMHETLNIDKKDN